MGRKLLTNNLRKNDLNNLKNDYYKEPINEDMTSSLKER